MKFIADFHIHSHFSIATSKLLIPEYLDFWAKIKGIQVVGTGDFTHPGWTAELKEKLEPAEPGLFRLKPGLTVRGEFNPPLQKDDSARFMLTAEISNIYKKGDKVRKVHNVLFAPDFKSVESLQQKLQKHQFNITSDGRPILGLDSRDLLEMALEVSEEILFIPAHIWTPWFSAMGAKSGFDSIQACYADLAHHIHAVETGLSSDPDMNRLCSSLDGYTLISNSDAHSPEKLGREANLLDTELSYNGIVSAIKAHDPKEFLGTLEFFPQEGKYHHDGHRKCGIAWEPHETRAYKGICPACGKKVTVGVMHRVMELADRESPDELSDRPPFHSLIPLKEILSEMIGVGPNSKQVTRSYQTMIQKMGSEFDILLNHPLDFIEQESNALLAEAIRRMRNREVILKAGYDGEFGVIKVFGDEIRHGFGQQKQLFQNLITPAKRPALPKPIKKSVRKALTLTPDQFEPVQMTLNEEQAKAVVHGEGPALVLAGPGTGKTRVLTERIVHLVHQADVDPSNILAVTFTNKASREMRERLQKPLKPEEMSALTVTTFHAFGYAFLKAQAGRLGRTSAFQIIDHTEREEILTSFPNLDKKQIRSVSKAVTEYKQGGQSIDSVNDAALQAQLKDYDDFLCNHNLIELDDLIYQTLGLWKSDPQLLGRCREKYSWILIDEYQDINAAQYRLIRMLAGDTSANLFAIGDPNQAIYGFRGADVKYIRQFREDYPEAKIFSLNKSYRCTGTILRASHDVLRSGDAMSGRLLEGLQEGVRIQIMKHRSDKAEAEYIARSIEGAMGGLRFFSMDSAITEGSDVEFHSLSDFAVLCRTGAQMEAIKKAFQDHSIPCQWVGEESLFKAKPVRKILNWLRLSEQPENMFFKGRCDKVLDQNTMADILSKIQESPTFQDKLKVLRDSEMIEAAESIWPQLESLGNGSLYQFLRNAALGAPIDTFQFNVERVALLTLHAAKGLEFPCVFIAGCEEGLIPFQLYPGQEADIEEEGRLLYVGMTRAKQLLTLSYAMKRTLKGRTFELKRSRFLDKIEKDLILEESVKVPGKKTLRDDQLKLF